MRMHPREFPPTRRRKLKRQAERQTYEALAGISCRGFVYYEWRRGYERIELDFAVWVENLGRIALQVKGGRYPLSGGGVPDVSRVVSRVSETKSVGLSGSRIVQSRDPPIRQSANLPIVITPRGR